MLAALHEDVRVYASAAEKGRTYLCPACKAELVLRKGAIRIHHFAHRPPAGCLWSRGETIAHLEAKLAIHRAFQPRAFKAEMEWPLEALDGDRRADVFVWDMRGGKVAFELQHTAIGADEIATRSAAYMRAGVAVMWIPFLRPRYRAAAERAAGGSSGDWVIRRYTPQAFERWLVHFQSNDLWYWAERSHKLMRGRLETLEEGGPARTLKLWGPYDPARLAVLSGRRKPSKTTRYSFPGGPSVRLEPTFSSERT